MFITRNKFTTLFSGALLATTTLLSGCGSENNIEAKVQEPVKPAASKEYKKHPVTGEALADKQILIRGNGSEPGSIDPQLVEGSVGGHISRDLFEGLTTSGANGELLPGVAESWEAKDGNLIWVFKLPNNAKWSDGSSVTAHDFVYAWKRAVDPKLGSTYAYYMELAGIKNAAAIVKGEKQPEELGVKAIDDYTFEISLEAPIPYLAMMTTHYTMYPSPKKAIEAHGSDWTKPGNIVTNGAYTLKEWSVGEKMVVVRSPSYWDNAKTIIDEVVYLPIESQASEIQRYEASGMHFTSTVPTSQLNRLKKERPEEVTISPLLGTYMYQFNIKEEPFNDVRIRKALSLAVDRDIIVKHITKGGQIPAYSMTPGNVAGFKVPEIEFAKWTQEQRDAEAVKLLTEAGYNKDNPLSFELLYNTGEGHKSIAVAISQMWKEKLGVVVTPTNMEWKTFLSEKTAGNFKVARYGWIGDYNEASTFLSLMLSNSGNNDGKWSNAEFDKLLNDARFEPDPNVLYTKAEQILAEEMPVIPIYFYTRMRMIDQKTGGFAMNNVQDNLYSKDMYIKAN